MSTRCSQWLAFSSLLILFTLAGCGSVWTPSAAKAVSQPVSSTGITPTINNESTVKFTLSGGNSGSYTVYAALPTSKLRHGRREFTIDVEHAGMSVFLVFYGYQGPGTYTLAEDINGGDVHIALGKDMLSWDLSLQLKARCTMTVQSDIPTQSVGLDRMKGSFSCPLLFSSAPNHPEKPVTVHNGSFDVAIIVES